ncbi:MAG: DUF2922 domain-containing protein [Synergistaceae bacterium]|jgi:hypothetical protein|nr:DUF2922 domain-containing protein [Synergistaceae bacterium]
MMNQAVNGDTKKRVLRMRFVTDEGKKTNISLSECKEGVTAEEVGAAMDKMLANQVFIFGLDEKGGAAVVETTVTELF